ncbi:MAG: hypothetical protein AAGF54_05245 [Pseudomonadota bacterium]
MIRKKISTVSEQVSPDVSLKLVVRKPSVLLLQGPIGPFFKELQRELESQGSFTKRVIFNIADRFYSGSKNVEFFNLKPLLWESWLNNYIDAYNFDVIVLFGCEREQHIVARKVANERDIKVLSLEEGYIRPGFITAELGGNNRFSPMNHFFESYNSDAPVLSERRPIGGGGVANMAWYAFIYFTLRAAGRTFNSKEMRHKNRPVIKEAFFWIRNFIRKFTRSNRNNDAVNRIIENHAHDYFFVPLQVTDDMQLLNGGRGWSNLSLIESTLSSFAKNASSEKVIVFKVHPLERGHFDYEKIVSSLARKHGCEDRAFVVDDGDIGILIRESTAVMTINSSCGFLAIRNGKPLAVLGEAIYRNEAIAHCVENEDDIDGFWKSHKPARGDISSNFINQIRAKALLSGDFYRPEGRKVACKLIANKVSTLSYGRLKQLN